MNYRVYMVLAVCAALILVGAGGVLLWNSLAQPAVPEMPQNSGSEPILDIPGTPQGLPVGVVPEPTTSVSLATFTKTKVQARDFTKDPDVLVLADRIGAEYYSLGSVPDDPLVQIVSGATSSPASKARGYEILYFPSGTLTVRIVREPIADLRRAAMDDVLKRLAIRAEDFCTVLIDVRVDVDGIFAGKHIGFPGCTGARILPGDTN